MIAIECKDVIKKFGNETVLDHVSFQFEAGNIYALLGRNGAGKTTLMNCICTKYLPDQGEVKVLEEVAYENEKVLRQICFMSDNMETFETKSVKMILCFASTFYDNWNVDLMERLLSRYEIDRNKKYIALSKGQKTAVGIIIGLCSGCEIVMFDEIYSGLDAVARQQFYELLLEEQEKNSRTFVLSTHLIEEMTGLFSHVLMLNDGKVLLCEEMEEIHRKSFKCTGRTDCDSLLVNKTVLQKKEIGTLVEYSIYDEMTNEERHQLETAGFRITSMSLQELFIAFTLKDEEEWRSMDGIN